MSKIMLASENLKIASQVMNSFLLQRQKVFIAPKPPSRQLEFAGVIKQEDADTDIQQSYFDIEQVNDSFLCYVPPISANMYMHQHLQNWMELYR